MKQARNKNGLFDALTEKRVTYRRSAADERAAIAAGLKENQKWQIEILKEMAFEAGQRDRRSGRTAPGRPLVTESAKKILGVQKATTTARSSYMAGWRSNPAAANPNDANALALGREFKDSGLVDDWGRRVIEEQIRRLDLSAKQARAIVARAARDNKPASGADIARHLPKKNPSAAELDREVAAADIVESWTGRPARFATDYIEKLKYHDKLAELARLYELKVRVLGVGSPQWVRFDAKTKLGFTYVDKRQQLHIDGGDQSLDLLKMGIPRDEADKDLVFVGPCVSITYDCVKLHLGESKPVKWEHKFGEEGGAEPMLVYDALNERILLAGGSYYIKLRDYDGKHSRGIVN